MNDTAIDVEWDEVRAVFENVRSFLYRSVVGALDEQVVFVHVPKCGGRSVRMALNRVFKALPGRRDGRIVHLHPGAAGDAAEHVGDSVWAMRRRVLAYHLAHPDVQCLAGHFQIDETLLDAHRDSHLFTTLLRDPVDRWISHYFFNRYKSGDHYSIDRDLDAFLETDRAQAYGELYVNYLTGFGDRDTGIGQDPEVMELAKRNLRSFDVVGFLEDLGEFCDTFEERTGAELKILHRNKNPAPKRRRREEMTDAARQRIRELCEPDLELYETAREAFG